LIPLHYISTTAVFSPRSSPVTEYSAIDPHHMQSMSGYSQTKWISEKILLQAHKFGFPCVIYRPSSIVGHPVLGTCKIDDFVHRIIRTAIIVKSYGDSSNSLNLVPVDYVSKAIVSLSREPSTVGKCFNLVNSSQKITFNQLMQVVISSGKNLQKLNYQEWIQTIKVETHSNQHLHHLIGPLLDILSSQFPQDHTFDDSLTQQSLTPYDISKPNITQVTWLKTLYYIKENTTASESAQYSHLEANPNTII